MLQFKKIGRFLLHEIGHCWGLDCQLYAWSVMNAAPLNYPLNLCCNRVRPDGC